MTNSTNNLLLLLLLLFFSGSSTELNDGDELQTLLTIKRDWGSPAAFSSWEVRSSISFGYCDWVGVVCTDGEVTSLSFPSFQIANPIPTSICSLKNLQYLDLSYNNLTGDFPTVLYGCSALVYLDLSNNELSGRLYGDIDKLSLGMLHLNLSSNAFVGDVPLAIEKFSKLKSLVLDSNSFNGNYPGAAIGGLVELETLTLANNPFEPSPVPKEFGNLTKLKLLWLSWMNMTGTIPNDMSSLTELTLLDLSQNKMQGQIPEWVLKHHKLENLYLYASNLSGEISPNITALNLQELDLSMNKLSGSIPEDIANLKKLRLLYLYYNNLTGPIPAGVGMMPNLTDIRLFNNKLSGPLPTELGKHSELGNFEVSNNNLSGELPDTLCFNKKLYDIVVFNNSFSGVFPANLGDCETVNNIMAYNNHFVGDFPKKIWSFELLTNVMIYNNNFTGTLPSEISFNISRIEMENNRFSGALPSAAVGLKSFTAENNQFSGELPTDMSRLANLTELNLAGNQLSGSIPPSIKSLTGLTSLNLSRNRISGEIPAAVGWMGLYILDLSSNQLSGEVPAALQTLAYEDSFLDNPSLCCQSESGMHIRTCPWSQSMSHDHLALSKIAILVILPCITLASVAITGWLLLLRRKKGPQDVTSWKMTQFRTIDFTEHDIVSNISECNVIGRGGSGKVYRIHLGGDIKAGRHGGGCTPRTVAVKRIGNTSKLDTNLDKEFESEVRTLGDLRHSNIVDLLCCISSQETKLLVYEHMENGSLDQWLHRYKRAGKSGPLDWPTRVAIAIDVARGLSYMHEEFVQPVIHRDVKCSNILLDREFRAKIADFGLARILAKSGESESASAVCGTFGYIAPEYVYRSKVSVKVDVYSFGVVLLELATGRGPQDGGTESGSCLAKWASKRYNNGGPVADLVDGEIQDPSYLDDMVAVFELGVVCTSEEPASRPPMSDVLHRLMQFDHSGTHSDGVVAKGVFDIDDSSDCIV
ncbi:receptor-like protein kinase HSL1 [Oryza glaberrima]|uniref:non-specific serine/threonine protein kinase n=1 Tax=Oryza glaberrima TaxID=4538 RepID=I1NYP5_ORYGL|nr:receptor-like protein kinase HSL1 [Oryza glaberrima]